MTKVPLHEYEKAKAREKFLGWVDTVLKWFAICLLVSIPLGSLALLLISLWVLGHGWAVPLAVVTIASVGAYAYYADKDNKTLQSAAKHGVIDE